MFIDGKARNMPKVAKLCRGKLRKEYLNDLLCKFDPFCLQHFKTFDISHTFVRVTVAELSTLKQVRFFGPPCIRPRPLKQQQDCRCTYPCRVVDPACAYITEKNSEVASCIFCYRKPFFALQRALSVGNKTKMLRPRQRPVLS